MSYEQNKDDMMIAHVRQSLETHSQQAHDFDQQLQRLAEQAQRERQKRLQQHQAHKKWWYLGGSLAIAASVMFISLNPLQTHQAMPTPSSETIVANATVEPQLLEDMDMLIVLGEEQ